MTDNLGKVLLGFNDPEDYGDYNQADFLVGANIVNGVFESFAFESWADSQFFTSRADIISSYGFSILQAFEYAGSSYKSSWSVLDGESYIQADPRNETTGAWPISPEINAKDF